MLDVDDIPQPMRECAAYRRPRRRKGVTGKDWIIMHVGSIKQNWPDTQLWKKWVCPFPLGIPQYLCRYGMLSPLVSRRHCTFGASFATHVDLSAGMS